jgi:cytochrome c-type biogenesis protein CcmH
VRALAASLVALAILAGAASCGGGSNAHPTQQELEADLVCPTCHEPLDMSNSALALQMKREIREGIAHGETKQQIEDGLVAQLGPQVLGVPRTHGFDLLAWLIPFVGIALGAVALAGAAWYWSRGRGGAAGGLEPAGGPPLDPELDRRVDEELARFDG